MNTRITKPRDHWFNGNHTIRRIERIGNIQIISGNWKGDDNDPIIIYKNLLNPSKTHAISEDDDGSLYLCNINACQYISGYGLNSFDKLMREHLQQKEEKKKEKRGEKGREKKILSNLEEINAKLDNKENPENLKKIKKDTALLSLLSILRP